MRVTGWPLAALTAIEIYEQEDERKSVSVRSLTDQLATIRTRPQGAYELVLMETLLRLAEGFERLSDVDLSE